jgi:nuclear GTP-binding protein
LNLYNDKPDLDKMREVTSEPARVKPDRKWFGNIRTVDQKQLDKYKAEVAL